jgi:glycosyltransferase involved in cell wall biosynthesis
MKIILANYRYYVSGGPEIYMFNVKRLLEDAGHVVIPFSVRSPLNEETPYSRYFPHGKSESGDAYFNNVKKTPKNVARLLSCAFYNREAYRNLRRLIRDERPDVVYVLQQINALSPSIFKACHDEGVRVVHRLSDFNIMCPRSDFLCNGKVCTACINGDYSKAAENSCCHGSKATTAVRIASMKFHRCKRLFDYVDEFVCPSEFTASLLVKSGISAKKVNVVPTFTSAPSSNGDEVAVEPYALYLGRISAEKGVDLLVNAASLYQNVVLKITGRTDDDYAFSVKASADEAGLADRIDFVGFVQGEEKERLINGASCVLCPSTWYENMPNTILEAYAHGKPVVVFDIGCMPELVEDGETGSVLPLGDVDALGKAIAFYLTNPDEAKRQGMNGRNAVLNKYTPQKHLEKLEAILDPARAKKED